MKNRAWYQFAATASLAFVFLLLGCAAKHKPVAAPAGFGVFPAPPLELQYPEPDHSGQLLRTSMHALAPHPSHYRVVDDAVGAVLLPDPETTPGAVRTNDANEVCHTSTKAVRHVTQAQKRTVYRAYGAVEKAGECCEVDHLISLELGGSNDTSNLWPQPYLPKPGAHEKDQLENWLHAQVCSGKMTLTGAQGMIAKDWWAAYQLMQRSEAK